MTSIVYDFKAIKERIDCAFNDAAQASPPSAIDFAMREMLDAWQVRARKRQLNEQYGKLAGVCVKPHACNCLRCQPKDAHELLPRVIPSGGPGSVFARYANGKPMDQATLAAIMDRSRELAEFFGMSMHEAERFVRERERVAQARWLTKVGDDGR